MKIAGSATAIQLHCAFRDLRDSLRTIAAINALSASLFLGQIRTQELRNSLGELVSTKHAPFLARNAQTIAVQHWILIRAHYRHHS